MLADPPVVVIGSGPCGAGAAARLVEGGQDVLLLDAGTHAPKGIVVKAKGNTMFRWVSHAELADDRHDGDANETVDWYSSQSLGGLSNYWTAAVPRYAPADFTEGAAVDERYQWPITYDDLVPYYEAAERLLEITAGPSSIPGVPPNREKFVHVMPRAWRDVIATANASGHHAGVLPMAKGRPWMVAFRGSEFNSYHCVVAPLRSERAFELRKGARVTRLNWSEKDERVDSVEYADAATGALTTVPARAVVVTAGVIDTTALLLRSTSAAFPTGLGNTNGVIGRYLHDHPREWWTAQLDAPLPALSHPVYVARDEYGGEAPLLATSLTIGLARPADRLKTLYRGRSATLGVQVFGTMIPLPEVGVTLHGDRPAISLAYDDQTLANLASARGRLRAFFADAAIKAEVPGPFHEVNPGSAVHYGGTVRMHHSREFGAVNASNRLHDVPNVAVCDASCFTTGPEKNPTLTAMAIAVRAADHLADDLSHGRL
jgi:choline dehydrogenase-like flavoprotein